MKMQIYRCSWILILVTAIQKTFSMTNDRKRMFRFTRVSTIQAVSNSDKIQVGKPQISTESTSVIFCATLLMQYGPFTCMEYYDLQNRCRSYHEGETVDSLNSKMDTGWTFYNAENNNSECKLDGLGQEYRGKVNTTVTGIQCMVWSAPGPHYIYPELKDKLSRNEGPAILNTNYCRNPDGEPKGPWCYTVDPNIRWRYCDIPYCQCYTQ